MQYLADKLGGKGDIVILLGDLANNSTINRTKGVKEVLAKYPEIKVDQEQTGIWLRDKAMTLTNDWITQGREFDAVVSNNDEMAIGAAMALQQAGKTKGEIPVVGIDGLPDGLAAIKRGQLAASVFQDPKAQSSKAVDVALKLIKGEPVEPEIWVPFKLITPDQVALFEQNFN